jgi:hypothetical protein
MGEKHPGADREAAQSDPNMMSDDCFDFGYHMSVYLLSVSLVSASSIYMGRSISLAVVRLQLRCRVVVFRWCHWTQLQADY